MNCYRLLILGPIFIFAVATSAQQAATSAPAAKVAATSGDSGLPSVEDQLKVLTEKLDLSADQQSRIKPILKDLHDSTEKITRDKNLSHDEQLAKVRPQRYKANDKIRALLSEDQRKKLDLYLQGPHGEMHGNLTGASPQPQQPPKP